MKEATMTAGMRCRLFMRSLLIQSLWSFENMQGLGFGYCMEPWLRRCYNGSGEGARRALARHCEYYNTQPYMAGLGLGMACALEAGIAASPEGERAGLEKRLVSLKASVSGPLAAIGDSFFWGAWRPFCAALACVAALTALELEASATSAALLTAGTYVAAFNVPVLLFRWRSVGIGFECRDQIARGIGCFSWHRHINVVRLTGVGLAAGCALAALFSIMGGSPWERFGFAAALGVGWAARAHNFTSRKLYLAAWIVGMLAAAAAGPW